MVESLEKQLARIMSKNIKMQNGKTIYQNLESGVNYLYECIDKFILEYYASYTPLSYKRTYDFMDSLYAQDIVHARVNKSKSRIELDVSFIPSMAYHKNLYNTHFSYVPLLINSGWHSAKLEQYVGKIPRFTEYEGYHFIEKGIRYFNKTNTYGIRISPEDVQAVWKGVDINELMGKF